MTALPIFHSGPHQGTVPAVDLFCGGGGFSEGVERAVGAPPMLVINHCSHAIRTHRLAHPASEHVEEDVFKASPYTYIRQGVALRLVVASPSCTHHSRAAGGQPLNEQLRSHPDVILAWAREHFPPVIIVENVAEMKDWCPVHPLDHPVKKLRGRPVAERKGESFNRWVKSLERLGYEVKWWVLNAADYGAPTARRRLFVVATHRRKHGRPPVKPEPTHGPGLIPYRTAGSIIDWSIPTCSIFADRDECRAYGRLVKERLALTGRYTDLPRTGTPKRPLADATLRRIAAGVKRFVLDAAKPFIVSIDHQSTTGQSTARGLDEPLSTLTTKARHIVVEAGLINTRNGERKGQAPRVRDLQDSFPTVTAQGSQGAVAAVSLLKMYGTSTAADMGDSLPTITAGAGGGHLGVIKAAFLAKHFGGPNGHANSGQDCRDPLSTVTTSGQIGPVELMLTPHEMGRAKQVYAFLTSYYGTGVGQALSDPMRTVTTHDRFGLVTVTVGGEPRIIGDIGMRMLQPHELADAMGFSRDFPLIGSKAEQTARIGNAVCPDVADAVIRAQYGITSRWVAEPGEAK